LLALSWSDVDLARGTIAVRESKTDAGVRCVYLLPPLRDELAAHKATRHPERDAFVFGTAAGRRDGPTNVRRRALAPAVELANERLREEGSEPIPDGITPHALRRTFASILVACGEDPRHAMGQLGHADAGFTLRTYAQQMDRRDGERERLAALVRGEAVPCGYSTDPGPFPRPRVAASGR
jgi:integrase